MRHTFTELDKMHKDELIDLVKKLEAVITFSKKPINDIYDVHIGSKHIKLKCWNVPKLDANELVVVTSPEGFDMDTAQQILKTWTKMKEKNEKIILVSSPLELNIVKYDKLKFLFR